MKVVITHKHTKHDHCESIEYLNPVTKHKLITPFTQNTNKKEMGRIDEQEEEWPTLCLKIQDPADVAHGIRILRGEESLGKIRCIQL